MSQRSNFPRPKKQKLPPKQTTKSWLDQKHSIRDVAQGVMTVGKYVAALVNTQLKNYDFQPFTSSSISNGGTIICLSGAQAGTASSNYIGAELHAKELQTNCHITLGSTATSALLRVIVFQDSNCTGSLPGVTDVLTSASVDSFYNIANFNPEKMRFTILSDERYCIGTNWQQVLCCGQKYVIPKADQRDEILYLTPFNGSTASLGKNNIFVLAISDQSVTANEPVLNMTSRLYFESM
jgi:hypothetical protein